MKEKNERGGENPHYNQRLNLFPTANSYYTKDNGNQYNYICYRTRYHFQVAGAALSSGPASMIWKWDIFRFYYSCNGSHLWKNVSNKNWSYRFLVLTLQSKAKRLASMMAAFLSLSDSNANTKESPTFACQKAAWAAAFPPPLTPQSWKCNDND